MSGYRYFDGHVKLGSKIHVNDFVYAKRLFQNSYYALRFAFQIASYIDQNLDKWLQKKESNSKKLCILGYGLYSELTVSGAARLLQVKKPLFDVSHAIVSDVETGRIEGESNLRDREVILVIPIASTLATAMKVIYSLRVKNKLFINPINPPLNLVIAGHRDLLDIADSEGNITDITVERFWKSIDIQNQIILTKYPAVPEQTYFVHTSIGWSHPESCVRCIPPNDKKYFEIPLLETDKTSVTPLIVLGTPLGKQLPNTPCVDIGGAPYSKECPLDITMITYSHLCRGQNHYLFYIDTQKMINRNKTLILQWCEAVKLDLKKKFQYINRETDYQAFIVAPAHMTNAAFISYINNYVFDGTATIFYYEPEEDFTENIGRFLLKRLPQNARVFLVDDALCTGKTFYSINNLIKSQSGFDGLIGVFVLLNRLDCETQELILKDLKGFLYAFLNLEAPVINTTLQKCYLCNERDRYSDLQNISILDSTKIFFEWSKTKLKVTNVFDYNITDKEETDKFQRYKSMGASSDRGRYFRKLVIGHRLLTAFRDLPDEMKNIFNDIKYNRLNDLLKALGFDPKNDEHRVNLLKIISEPPYSYYSIIKKTGMRWILEEFYRVLELLKTDNWQSLYDILNGYRYFKLLVKRLSHLKSSALIREDVLEDILLFYQKYKQHWRQKLVDEINRQSELIEHEHGQVSAPYQMPFYTAGSLDSEWNFDKLQKFLTSMTNFNLYYGKAVKESIYLDEMKSLVLETSLNAIDSKPYAFRSLIRILRIENDSVIRAFMDWIQFELISNEYTFTQDSYHDDVNILISCLLNNETLYHYKASPLIHYIGLTEDIKNNPISALYSNEFIDQLIPLIFIRFVLNKYHDKTLHVEIAKERLQYILFLVCRLLSIDIGNNGGIFCIARCGVVGSINSDTIDVEKIGSLPINAGNFFYDITNTLFYNVLTGYCSDQGFFPWSNVELKRHKDHFVNYSGTIIHNDAVPEANPHESRTGISIEINHLFYIRLSDEKSEDYGTGVIVVYHQEPEFFNEKEVRYSMMFRNDLSRFIKRNFNNDQFRSWLYEQRESILIETMHHGFERELSDLRKIVVDETYENHIDLVKNFNILHRALYSKIPYALLIKDLHKEGIQGVFKVINNHKISKEKIYLSEIYNYTRNLANFIFSKKVGGDEFPIEVEILPCGLKSVLFYKNLLYDALFEIIRNAKTHVDETKVYKDQIIPVISLQVKVSDNGGINIFIRDNGKGAHPEIIRSLNKYGWYSVGRGLKMFGYLWSFLVREKFVFESEVGKYFIISFPIGENNE